MMSANRRAFLDMIAISEGTYGIGDNGYNVIVGSTPEHPILFDNYAAHPRVKMRIESLGVYSTAAGRYQLLYRYWVAYCKRLGLTDFSPATQDAIAIKQIRECRALDDIDAGRLDDAVAKCARIWASFPGAGYGQQQNALTDLRNAYQCMGGFLCPSYSKTA